jgi:hypothetical protein
MMKSTICMVTRGHIAIVNQVRTLTESYNSVYVVSCSERFIRRIIV